MATARLPRAPAPEMTLRLDGAPFQSGRPRRRSRESTASSRSSSSTATDADTRRGSRSDRPGGGRAPQPHHRVAGPGGSRRAEGRGLVAERRHGRLGRTCQRRRGDGLGRTLPSRTPSRSRRGRTRLSPRDATRRDASARPGRCVLDTVGPRSRSSSRACRCADGRLRPRCCSRSSRCRGESRRHRREPRRGAAGPRGRRSRAEGVHELAVASEDRAGNRSTRSVRFTVDITPPLLAITQRAPGALFGSLPAALSGTCGDAVPRVLGGAGRRPGERGIHLPGLALRRGTEDGRRLGRSAPQARATAEYVVDVEAPVLYPRRRSRGRSSGLGLGLFAGRGRRPTRRSAR